MPQPPIEFRRAPADADRNHPQGAVALYDNGLKTEGLSVFEVLKVGRVKVRVRDEHGREGWLYPAAIDREVTEERYVELMDEIRPS